MLSGEAQSCCRPLLALLPTTMGEGPSWSPLEVEPLEVEVPLVEVYEGQGFSAPSDGPSLHREQPNSSAPCASSDFWPALTGL